MTASWTLAVARDDLAQAHLLEGTEPEVGAGEALLRVDRVGVTVNNVTYAVLGDAFRYWEFFPTEPGLGLVPLWGFADVAASRAPGVEVGSRVYGYLPPAGHLLVRPGRVDERGFRDVSQHRASLPSPYNTYASTTTDPAYDAAREDLQVLFRPLFFTSFMLADQLTDDAGGAEVLALSSASSKTAYGTAFLLRGGDAEVVGLTAGQRGLHREPGLLRPGPALRRRRPGRQRAAPPGPARAPHPVVGARPGRRRHPPGLLTRRVAGRGPAFGLLRARPDAAAHRRLGPGRARRPLRTGLDRFVPVVEGWVDVQVGTGPEGLRHAWIEVLSGAADPRTGHVVQLGARSPAVPNTG